MPVGRPRKLTKARLPEYLDLIRQGMMRGAAADQMNLSRRLTREFILENPEVEAGVLDAEVDATEHVMEALYQAATSGSVAAAKAWIELKSPKKEASAKPTSGRVSPGVEEPPPPVETEVLGDFDALDNVTALDPRARRRQPEF